MSGIGKRRTELKYPGIYRALVLDNNDPNQYGRIKARIYPFFADLEAEEVPWAVPAFSLFEGAGLNGSEGIGSFTVPKVGAYVFTFFEGENIYQPVYFAEAPTTTYGLPSARTTNYPNRKVWRTEGDIEIIVDDEVGLIRINHPTGTYIEIQEDGDIFFNPNTTHRTIANALSHTVTFSGSGILTGDDGGLVCVSGGGSITLPSATEYEGLMYKFKRITNGVHSIVGPPAIDALPAVPLIGIWAKLHVISNGIQWLDIT